MAAYEQSLGDIVRNRRIELNMSQRELSTKVGISHSTLSRLENHPDAFADTRTLVALSQALGIDLTSMVAAKHGVTGEQENISLIARARSKMPLEDQQRMMEMLRREFEEYFDEEDDTDRKGLF